MLMFHFLLINFFQTKLSNIQAQNALQKPVSHWDGWLVISWDQLSNETIICFFVPDLTFSSSGPLSTHWLSLASNRFCDSLSGRVGGKGLIGSRAFGRFILAWDSYLLWIHNHQTSWKITPIAQTGKNREQPILLFISKNLPQVFAASKRKAVFVRAISKCGCTECFYCWSVFAN